MTSANPRYANGHRRRQAREWVLATQDVCGICGGHVDKSLTTFTDPADGKTKRHPMSAEVDEIIPVSKGGSPYERDNLRLAHRICNQKRGNKTSQTRITKPFRTSREW